MDKRSIVAGITHEREVLTAFLRDLTPEQWRAPSKCEGWSVRDVLAHLVGNCDDVVAGRLEDFGSFEFNQRQLDARTGVAPAGLLAEWARVGPKAEATYEAIPDESWDTYLPAIGMTLGAGVQRMLEDLWVHAHDIRLALGTEAVPGPGLGAALEVIALDLRARVPAFAPSVGAVSLRAGAFADRIELGAGAEVSVEGDPVDMVLAGTGRLAIADARITVEPLEPGFAEAFNIYGTPVPASPVAEPA